MMLRSQLSRLPFALLLAALAGCDESTSEKVASLAKYECSTLVCEDYIAESQKSECIDDAKTELSDSVAETREDGFSSACIDATLDAERCDARYNYDNCRSETGIEYRCEDLFDRASDACE